MSDVKQAGKLSARRPMRGVVRGGVSALLVVALSAAFIPSALALTQKEGGASASGANVNASADGAADSTATFEKSETVYASLDGAGSPQAVYVVNRFDVEAAGRIVDAGDYTNVRNLTDETTLTRDGETTVFDAEEGVLFYQGDAGVAALPWNVALTYQLDGKTVAADALAGATGKLSIRGTTTQNAAVDPAFFESFMMQVTFTLAGASASDIVAEGATVASAGEDWTVAFTVLPGREGVFELTCQVKDFSMDGVQIVALPYSSVVEMPDTSDVESSLTDLADAISKLNDGTAQLATGARSLESGARDFSSGVSSFGEGLAAVSASSAEVVEASSLIKQALDDVAAGLAGADLSGLVSLPELPTNLRTLAGGLDQLAASASAVQGGYSQALVALDVAIAAIPDAALTDDDLAALLAAVQGTDEAQTAATLVQSYRAAQAVRAVYYGDGTTGGKQAFEGAGSLLENLAADAASGGALATQAAALRSMADALETSLAGVDLSELSQLVSGISDLATEYGQFHSGLVQYTGGVSALVSNYRTLDAGASSFAAGVGTYASGVSGVATGMAELDAATATLPQTMRERMDDLMADYEFPAFVPVSFASPENDNVTAVQFVMTTPAIEAPAAPVEQAPDEPTPTLWDRFLALFQ